MLMEELKNRTARYFTAEELILFLGLDSFDLVDILDEWLESHREELMLEMDIEDD